MVKCLVICACWSVAQEPVSIRFLEERKWFSGKCWPDWWTLPYVRFVFLRLALVGGDALTWGLVGRALVLYAPLTFTRSHMFALPPALFTGSYTCIPLSTIVHFVVTDQAHGDYNENSMSESSLGPAHSTSITTSDVHHPSLHALTKIPESREASRPNTRADQHWAITQQFPSQHKVTRKSKLETFAFCYVIGEKGLEQQMSLKLLCHYPESSSCWILH